MTHDLSPLRPLEFFKPPWSGPGELVPRFPGQRHRTFAFRSETEFLTETEWLVHDTTDFDDGETSTRTMRARLVGPDRIAIAADDMPRGAELQLEERGFRFRPYLLEVPVGRTRVRVRCDDRCRLDEQGVLHDEIEMRFMRVRVGRITMALTPELTATRHAAS